MKITENIFQVGGNGLSEPDDAAVYLIHFSGHAALVDSGCGKSVSRIIKNIKKYGVKPKKVEYLLLTHCHFDHVGGAAALKDKLKCQIAVHEKDAPFLEKGDSVITAASWYGSTIEPFSVDIRVSKDVQEIFLGDHRIQAVHIPGHSPGSVAYLTESEGKKVLFAQDVHGPLAPSLLSNAEDYRNSLEKLLALEADILCEGHHGVYRGKEEVKGFINTFLNPLKADEAEEKA